MDEDFIERVEASKKAQQEKFGSSFDQCLYSIIQEKLWKLFLSRKDLEDKHHKISDFPELESLALSVIRDSADVHIARALYDTSPTYGHEQDTAKKRKIYRRENIIKRRIKDLVEEYYPDLDSREKRQKITGVHICVEYSIACENWSAHMRRI